MLLPVHPDSTIAFIIMKFCHFCGMQSFVSGSICLFQAGIQNCPGGSTPVPSAALPAPATATSRGAARPSSCRRRPRPPARARRPASAAGRGCRRQPRPALAVVAVVGRARRRRLAPLPPPHQYIASFGPFYSEMRAGAADYFSITCCAVLLHSGLGSLGLDKFCVLINGPAGGADRDGDRVLLEVKACSPP